MRAHATAGSALLALLLAVPAAADPERLVSVADAYIEHDSQARSWTIANGRIVYTIGFNDAGTLTTRQLASAHGTLWRISEQPDASHLVAGRSVMLGNTANGSIFRAASADEFEGGVRLRLFFDAPERQLRTTRSYLSHPQSPAIETWTTFEPLTESAAVSLSDVGIWQIGVDVDNLFWVNGLEAAAQDGGPFTRRHARLERGERIELNERDRSSEQAVPVFWMDGHAGALFAGIAWSGAWSATVSQPGTVAQVRISLGALATTVRGSRALQTPRAFFGVAPSGVSTVSRELAAYVRHGIRRGRPLRARVTYNTWFAYGVHTDEESMREEMAHAADLGVELFVLDAGWYPGGSQTADFTTGLGTWSTDRRRFPSGIAALAADAHALGLAFGIWVEPERVDTATINRPGLVRERWLATVNGRYNPGTSAASSALICLGDPEARRWVLERLIELIDTVRPEYVKWDNNYWINCTRSDHGHGAADGNFAHVQGLYEILDELRERYPTLMIENCSGGGNRLDFGMLRHTDAAWMDDRSAPSSHVRHNLEGLSAVFPPAYLLSFVMSDATEPMQNGSDLPLYFRSRMGGVLGMTFLGNEFTPDDREQMAREIGLYKFLRFRTLRDGSAVLLTEQASVSGNDRWDVFQVTSADGRDVVIFAFRRSLAPDLVVIRPQGLDADTTYEVRSGRRIALTGGADLMEAGIEIVDAPFSRAQIISLRRIDRTRQASGGP
jgi:alpha-galactosidase